MAEVVDGVLSVCKRRRGERLTYFFDTHLLRKRLLQLGLERVAAPARRLELLALGGREQGGRGRRQARRVDGRGLRHGLRLRARALRLF